MRQLTVIEDIWLSGVYTGLNRTHGRVTIEPDWYLNLSSIDTEDTSTLLTQIGTSKRGPFHWWQRYSNDQTEVELPNVRSINIDRSIDTDAGQCTITMYNTNMDYPDDMTVPTELGQPGYYTWNRGESEEANARWGHETNAWNNVIVPDALLRTYEGYGGYTYTDGEIVPMSIPDAVEAGNLVLTGVWLIDKVKASTDGTLNLTCRDMGKLLIDQRIWPPLIPARLYPLVYYRWVFDDFDASFKPRQPTVTGNITDVPLQYAWSSADAWYGFNCDIHGHHGTDSIDGDTNTFALSVGNGYPTAVFCTDYFEYTVGAQVNEIYLHPWGGNYQMFISVLENGVWQDGGNGPIPYDYTPLVSGNIDEFGDPRWVNTGADIPYISQQGVPWEQGAWFKLPRVFNAERIRITFRNHTLSQWGRWFYRCGIRELKARVNTIVETPPSAPYTFDAVPCRHPSDEAVDGYWAVDDSGYVFAFGDARQYTQNDTAGIDGTVVAMAPHPSSEGYWTLQTNGRVHSYGTATHHGDVAHLSNDFIDIACTHTGAGYYLIQRNGQVHGFGDAVHYGHMPELGTQGIPAESYVATGIETHPTDEGYWIVNGDGLVRAFGDLPHLGDVNARERLSEREWVRSIARNETGDGYWLLGGMSHVYPCGAHVENFGEIPDYAFDPGTVLGFGQLTWAIVPVNHDAGYMLLQADGHMPGFGDYREFGHPGGTGTRRSPGNYKDYTDIIREILLWSGWWLQKDDPPAGVPPEVFGNLENTGAYSEDDLGDQTGEGMFDKKAPMEIITQLKEIVGYIFHIDEEGGAHFETPNWWRVGNFLDDTGEWTDFIPEIDEDWTLMGFDAEYGDESARSEIVISSEKPELGNFTTKATRYIPKTADLLRGMTKPAHWSNGTFTNEDERRIMAELIALHIWFSMRMGNVNAPALPSIGLDDQVRIFEQVTSESFVHYVRGCSTQHDLETGVYTMSLTTNWLGTEDTWVISADDIPDAGTVGSGSSDLTHQRIQISQNLIDWLTERNSDKLTQATDNGFLSTNRHVLTQFNDANLDDTVQGDGAADGEVP